MGINFGLCIATEVWKLLHGLLHVGGVHRCGARAAQAADRALETLVAGLCGTHSVVNPKPEKDAHANSEDPSDFVMEKCGIDQPLPLGQGIRRFSDKLGLWD